MRVSFLCIYIFLSLSANAWAQDNQAMEDISLLKGLGVAGVECSLVASRLARLSCFDDVFGTEFEVDEVVKSSLPIKERAMSSELEREDSYYLW